MHKCGQGHTEILLGSYWQGNLERGIDGIFVFERKGFTPKYQGIGPIQQDYLTKLRLLIFVHLLCGREASMNKMHIPRSEGLVTVDNYLPLHNGGVLSREKGS